MRIPIPVRSSLKVHLIDEKYEPQHPSIGACSRGKGAQIGGSGVDNLLPVLPSVMHHHDGVSLRVAQFEFRETRSRGLVKHENMRELFLGNSKIKMRKRICRALRLSFFSVSKVVFGTSPPPFSHNLPSSLFQCSLFSTRAREVPNKM